MATQEVQQAIWSLNVTAENSLRRAIELASKAVTECEDESFSEDQRRELSELTQKLRSAVYWCEYALMKKQH